MGSKTALAHLKDYIVEGVSPFHTIAFTTRLLREAGFAELGMREPWQLEKGGKYYVTPFDSTLYAFTLGTEDPLGGRPLMGGAHVDWPGFKLKPHAEITRQGYLQCNAEVYGGPILNTWFDRPLGLAGKVAYRDGNGIAVKLVNISDPLMALPNLAVHMNRGINDEGKPIDQQQEMLPLAGLAPEGEEEPLKNLIAQAAGLEKSSLLDWDMIYYNPQAPTAFGLNHEFLLSPRLDDLTSACALIWGLMQARPREKGLNMVCLFDNEEVGSRTKQGADADLPSLIVKKIWAAFGHSAEDALSAMPEGLMMSMDVAHAYHPNYPQKQDITNYPVMGKGILFKSAANQSYAWDCGAMAYALDLCETNGIPCQRYVKRSGSKGGGTIGPVISSHLPIPTVDMGVGLMAMHSSCETMGIDDQEALERFSQVFFEALPEGRQMTDV